MSSIRRILAPAVRLTGVFLLYIAAICVNAEDGRSNPNPADCCSCLEIKFSGMKATGANAVPGQQPQFAVNKNGTVDMQVSVILSTTGPACTGVQVKKITVKDPKGGIHQDIALAPVVDPVAGKTTYSGTISVLQTVLDELGKDGWRIVVTTECPGSTIGTQECAQVFNFDGGPCKSCGSGGSCGPAGMPMFNNNKSTVGIPTTDSAGGDSSGFLRLDVGGFTNPGRAAIFPLVPSNFVVIKNAGLITSVNTGANTLDIAPADASLLAQDPNAFTVTHKTAGGQAFRTTTIAKVNEGGIPRIRLDSTFDGATYRSDQTNPQLGTFVLDEGRIEGGAFVALRRSSHAVEKPSAGVEVHRDIIQERATAAGAWQTVSDTRTKWENQIHGWVMTEQVVDPDGAALTSTWTYYQPGEQTGPGASIAGLGKLKSSQRYNGYQEFHTYALNTETTTSTYAGNPSGQVETTTWNPAARTRTRTTTIGGVEVGRTVTTYTDTSVTESVSTSAGTSLVTVTEYMPDGQDFGGKPKTITRPDGTLTTYSYSRDASGAKTTIASTGVGSGGTVTLGTKTTTVTNARGTTILSKTEGIGYNTGDALLDGMAVTAVDALGRATTTAWYPTAAAATGEVASATGAAWTTTTSYNCCGVASETDRTGITTFHAYDALQRPVKTNRLGVTVETVRDGLTTTNHRYPEVVTGSLSPALQGNEATCIAKTVSNLSGTSQESWTPDVTSATPGALVKTATVTSYNTNGSVSTQTNPLGGTVITESHPDGKTKSVSGSATVAQTYTYGTHSENGDGMVTTITTAGGAGGVTASYSDKSGRTFKTTKTAPHGQTAVTTTTYNAKGQAEVIASSDQPSVKYLYNDEGERVATWTDRNGDGQFNDSAVNGVKDGCSTSQSDYLAAASAPSGLGTCQRTISTVRTDADEDKILSTSWQTADGLRSRQETLGVAGATTRATVLQGSGATTTTQVNPDGTSTVAITSILANGNRQTTTNSYSSLPSQSLLSSVLNISDAMGRTIESTNGRGHVVQYAYTANGDQLASTTQVNAAPGGGNLVTSYAHTVTPGTGTLVTITLPDGSHQYQQTNLLGQTTRQWGSQTNPVSFTYDAAGRMTTHTTYRAAVGANADAFPSVTGDTTTWTYDPSGVLLQKTYADGKGPQYTYDIAGRILTRTWARGVVTTYAYVAGQLTATTYSNDPANTPSVAVTHDRLGLQVSQTNGLCTTAYIYDSNLRMITESAFIDPDGSGPLPSFTRTIDRSRDALQRPTGYELKTENLTLESSLGYGYDVSGRLGTISAAGLPNLAGRSHAFEYSYEPGSSMIDKVTGPVHEVDNDYEAHRNVLFQKKNTRTVGTPGELSVIGYGVNAIGQRVLRNLSGEIRAEFYGGQSTDIYATNWGYDPLGQVTGEDKPASTADRGYSYDLIGNRLTSSADASTTSYLANALNQYSLISPPSPASPVNPAFDDDGNMTTGLLNGSISGQFEYDGQNQLIRTQFTSTSDPTSYAYDAFGRRVAKVTYPNAGGAASDATVFIYDGWNLIAEYKLDSGAWTLDRTYTWGTDFSGSPQGAGGVGGLLAVRLLSPVSGASVFFPIYDGNGNIEAYLDSNSNPAAIYQYDAFGNILTGESKGAALEQVKFHHSFSTKYQDIESGLLYYGHRYFLAAQGRWVSRDPIEESGGLSLYAILQNSPMTSVDHLGEIDINSLKFRKKIGDHQIPQFGPLVMYVSAGVNVNASISTKKRGGCEVTKAIGAGEGSYKIRFASWGGKFELGDFVVQAYAGAQAELNGALTISGQIEETVCGGNSCGTVGKICIKGQGQFSFAVGAYGDAYIKDSTWLRMQVGLEFGYEAHLSMETCYICGDLFGANRCAWESNIRGEFGGSVGWKLGLILGEFKGKLAEGGTPFVIPAPWASY